MPFSHGEYLGEGLTVDEVADLLGVKPAAIRKQLSRGRFPEPVEGPKERLWLRHEVFRYAVEQGGDVARRVPRLFSRIPSPNPARFVSNTMFEHTFNHLHLLTLLPADGLGPVALAHPLNDIPHHGVIEALFEADPALTAVAVVRGDLSPGPHGVEVSVDVWEPGGKRYIASWSDLLDLVATSLPYWSRGLRQRSAMLAWRPGCSPAILTARDELVDPAPLLDLAEDVEPGAGRRALRTLACEIDASAADEAQGELDARPEFPGFQHAATVKQAGAPCEDLNDQDVSTLLHCAGLPTGKVQAALKTWGMWNGLSPFLHTVGHVVPAVTGLAAEWTQRLEPVEDARRDEFGYRALQRGSRVGARNDQVMLKDPLHPQMWVIRAGEVIHYSVPPFVPGAGVLDSVTILDGATGVAVFFRDSGGTVWPVPTHRTDYTVGYSGSGPYHLAVALDALMHDAGSDLRAETADPAIVESWMFRQVTSPTGRRTFTAEEISSAAG